MEVPKSAEIRKHFAARQGMMACNKSMGNQIKNVGRGVWMPSSPALLKRIISALFGSSEPFYMLRLMGMLV